MRWSGWMILPMVLAITGGLAMWIALIALAVNAAGHWRRHRHPSPRHHPTVP